MNTGKNKVIKKISLAYVAVMLIWLDIMQWTNACKHKEFPMNTEVTI